MFSVKWIFPRLFEAVIADGASGNANGFEADYAASERLWTNMTKQYAIDIEARKYTFKTSSIKKGIS